MALIESVVAALALVEVGGRACSSGGGKKECWDDADGRNGRSTVRFPELDTADINALLVSSPWWPSRLAVVPDGFLRLRSRSLSPSLSRSEPSPEAVPVVVSMSVPLVVFTSSRSLPSDISIILDFCLPSPPEDRSSLMSFSFSSS